MATRRCACGSWFRYDALVKDDAVECPECGRILPRGSRETWPAARLGRSLVAMSVVGAVVLAVGGIVAALGWLGEGHTAAGVVALVAGLIGAAILVLGGLTVRALADAVARLEDRIP